MRAGPIASAIVAIVLGVCPREVAAQHVLEARLADTEYRFADWSYTWGNRVVLDVFYVGVPGSNEFNFGGGYAATFGPVTLTPLVYAVIGKEGGQRGVKMAVLTAFDKSGWKLLSFLGAYAPASGDVGAYQVLDTLDVTRTFAGRWELGLQAGFFHADSAWNTQVGPLLKRTDRHGAWAISYRFGNENELRVSRVLFFSEP